MNNQIPQQPRVRLTVIPWAIGIFVLLLMGIFALAFYHQDESNAPSISSQQTQPTPSQETTAQKLAMLHSDNVVPDASLVKAFQDQLSILQAKCPLETEEQLGDYIYNTYQQISPLKAGYTLMDAMRGVIRSVPPDNAELRISCSSVIATYITLVKHGAQP